MKNKHFDKNSITEILNLNYLTIEQKQAITSNKTPILVSASAGSGKTSALCNRVLFKLLTSNGTLNLSNILVVSFTNASANEIFDRIKTKLYELQSKFSDETIIKQQIKFLSKKNITTIDSFCSNFLRENFEIAKIAPNFKIASEFEIFEMKHTILTELIETKLVENFTYFQNLSNYFNLKSTNELKQAILKIYETSRTYPFPEQFLIKQILKYKQPIPLNKNHKLIKVIYKEIIDLVEESKFLIESAENYFDDPILQKSYLPVFKKIGTDLNNLINKLKLLTYFDCFNLVQNFKFENLPRYNKKTNNFDQDLANMIKLKFFNPAKKLMQKATTLLFTNDQFLNDCKIQKHIINDLINLSFQFSKKINAKKTQLNLVDFSYLLLKTIHILAKPDVTNYNKFNLTNLGKKVSTKFNEILIDEFQDINSSQELLFNILSNNGLNLFAVGDLKQSIYRFRQADPQIFLNYRTTFINNNLNLISFNKNFRSSSEITNATNFLFSQIMSENFGGIDYYKKECLICCNKKVNEKNYPTEVHILTNDETENFNKIEFELEHIANQIKILIDNKFEIIENDRLISCQPKHFAIFLRSEKDFYNILSEKLDILNLPYKIEFKNEFLSSYVVSIVITLLKFLSNPLNDIACCAVLMSPLFKFTKNELLSIKLTQKQPSLYLNFKNSSEMKCKFFYKTIENLHEQLIILNISQLIQHIYNLNIFKNLIFYKPNNIDQQYLNLQNFLNLTLELEKNEPEINIIKFLKTIELIKNNNLTIKLNDKTNNDKSNAITITTIHKSKGLEFPIVFVALSARKFNDQNLKTPIIVSKQFGIGIKDVNLNNLNRRSTILYKCCQIDEKNESKAEELRLLYVAMTRAKQKLFLTAFDSKKKFKTILTYSKKVFSPSFCRSKNSFYDWILAGFSRHKNSHFNKNKVNFTEPEMQCNILIKSKFETPILNNMNFIDDKPKPDFKIINKIKNNLNFELKFKKQNLIPAKLSVSEIVDCEPSLKKLNFSDEISESEIETAFHIFLQHVNFQKAKKNLNDEIMNLIKLNLISKKQASILNLHQLNLFFQSSIFHQIETADSIEREQNFLIKIPANELINCSIKTPILVKGTIDLILEKNNELTIVDYKTNKISLNDVKNKYIKQINIYKKAATAIFQKPVTACAIYSFYLNNTILI